MDRGRDMRHLLTGLGLVVWAAVGVTIRLGAFDRFVIRAFRSLQHWGAEDVGRAAAASATLFCGAVIAGLGAWLVVRWKDTPPGEDPRLPLWARIAVLVSLFPFAGAYVHVDFARMFGVTGTLPSLLTMTGIALAGTVLWIVLVFRRGPARDA